MEPRSIEQCTLICAVTCHMSTVTSVTSHLVSVISKHSSVRQTKVKLLQRSVFESEKKVVHIASCWNSVMKF